MGDERGGTSLYRDTVRRGGLLIPNKKQALYRFQMSQILDIVCRILYFFLCNLGPGNQQHEQMHS